MQPQTVNLEIPSSHLYLNVVGACIDAILERIDSAQNNWLVYQVQLAVHETCTNIINHAYSGSSGRIMISFMVQDEPRSLVVDLYDDGVPFDTELLNQIHVDEPKTSGYGLFLMLNLMEKVDYFAEPGKNHWRLEKTL